MLFCRLPPRPVWLFGLLLVGCQALRGPEPLGPTFVSPPGPIVSAPGNAPVRVTPPTVTLPQTFTPAPAPQPIPQPPQTVVPPAGQVYMQVVAPTQGAAGGTLTYRVEVQNRTGEIARGILVTTPVTPGLTYLASNRNPALAGQQLQWSLGDLPGFGAATVDVSFRAEAAGTANFCADVSNAAGTVLRACAATSITGAATTPPPSTGPPATLLPLSVTMTGPERARVGDEVEFRVTIANRGTTKTSNLVLTDTFDAGLVHTVIKGEQAIERDVKPDLEPGESRIIKVTFRVTRAGRLCNRVVVTGPGGFRALAEACVQAADPAVSVPAVSVRMTAPESIAVGGKGLFRIEVRNTGDGDLVGLVVTSRFDLQLNPTQATQLGSQQVRVSRVGEQYELSPWRIDRMEAGRTLALEVECQGDRAATRACGRVSVVSRETASQEAVACTRIEGAGGASGEGRGQAPLSLKIGSLREPARVGDEVTYLVSVTNNSRTAVSSVVVQLTVSSQLSPPRAPDANPARSRIEGRTTTFDPYAQLRAGETLTYRLRSQALRAGAATLDVTLQASGVAAIRERKTTTIVP